MSTYYHRALHPGVTRFSLRAMKRHLSKIGTPQSVEAYSMNTRHKHDGVWHSTYQTYVLVRGTEGKIRFGGFSWGYSGEGPRGLRELFELLEVRVSNPVDWNIAWRGCRPSRGLYAPARHWRIDMRRPSELEWLERPEDWQKTQTKE